LQALAMLTVFLRGFPDDAFLLIPLGGLAFVALLGALLGAAILGRGGAGRTLLALLAGTLCGVVLAAVFIAVSASPLAWIVKGMPTGVLLTTFAALALGGGFAASALVARMGRPRKA
jgi:hypothetical protein